MARADASAKPAGGRLHADVGIGERNERCVANDAIDRPGGLAEEIRMERKQESRCPLRTVA